MKISYNWLQNYFEEKLPEPENLSLGIIFHSFEVEDIEKKGNDTIFDIKILPDRAHDCLSHWGIAKEVSAIFNLKIKDIVYKNYEPKSTELDIKIEDDPANDGASKCLRYMGRIVRNVKVGPSPEWLKEKLEAIGQKSINNIVDSANFVMFDLGQPIHCFDLDKLESAKIIVRNGKIGESLITLDKKEIKLDESILVIADGSTGSPQANEVLAIAGIKGGTKAEVDNNTKNIVIEVANFNATTTRKTAKKINILTDAVKRYENEISPELCEKTMNTITDLIFNLASGEVENIIDIYPEKIEQKEVAVSVEYINKRLGTSFSKEEIESVWGKLDFIYVLNDNEFKIKIPYFRLDITGPYDLVEEVGRILGYDRIEEKLPEVKTEAKINETFAKMLWTRNKLLEDGYSEVMTYVFRDKGEIEVLASASDKKFLRNNLSDGLQESLKLNQVNMPLLNLKEIKIFEIGTVFTKNGEEIHVAYNDKKNIIEKLLDEFVNELASSKEHGYFSAKKFLVFAPSRSQNSLEDATSLQKFKMWSLYPFISRDIALWAHEGTDIEEVKNLIKENAGELLVRGPDIFDEFKKEGRISYAFRLVFQSFERTLTDEEVSLYMGKISEKLISTGFDIR